MKSRIAALAVWCWALVCLSGLSGVAHARTDDVAKHPIVAAVHKQDCARAIGLINTNVGDNDAPTAFLAGRMLDEGICVQHDPELAAHFFARAADLGRKSAVLDYAAKVALGEGSAQDFARSGDLCRAAGVDAQGQLTPAALGYACAVASIAGRLLRVRLPLGAFAPVGGADVKVEFVPGSGTLKILAVPNVGRGDLEPGTYVRKPVIKADEEIDRSWREALQLLPAPPAAREETHPVTLSIDVDMTLEQGRVATATNPQRLVPGDLHLTPR